MTHIPEGNYLTLHEAAERADVARITVQKWIEHGLLPSLQIPRLGQLINEKDLLEFLRRERPAGYPKGKPRK
jgi:excisionase family DNA binding protein